MLYAKILKQSEETIVFLVTFLSLVAFQLAPALPLATHMIDQQQLGKLLLVQVQNLKFPFSKDSKFNERALTQRLMNQKSRTKCTVYSMIVKETSHCVMQFATYHK